MALWERRSAAPGVAQLWPKHPSAVRAAGERPSTARRSWLFNYFFTRKLNSQGDACPRAFPGRLRDDGRRLCFDAQQTGKARIIPVVLVDAPTALGDGPNFSKSVRAWSDQRGGFFSF